MSRRLLLAVGAITGAILFGCLTSGRAEAITEGQSEVLFDFNTYAFMMENEVSSLSDVTAFFIDQIRFYVRILPPDENFILYQPSHPTIIPFEASGFPKTFLANLESEYENGVSVYPISVVVDQKSHEVIVSNSKGKEIMRSSVSSEHEKTLADLLEEYDGAVERIHILIKLVETEDVEPFLYVQKVVTSQMEELMNPPMLMMMEGGTDDLYVSSIMRTNGTRLTINIPEGFTNRLDIYSGNNLLVGDWMLAEKELIIGTNNPVIWHDTNQWSGYVTAPRFYTAGNADLDSDGDGYPDAREILIYKTDPTNQLSKPITVSGLITYSGSETGAVIVAFVTNATEWIAARTTYLSAPGAYTNTEIANGQAYWIKAYMDVNGNNFRDDWEPCG